MRIKQMRKSLILLSVSAIFLASCVSNPEGQKAETSNAVETTVTTDGNTLAVDTSTSTVEWLGQKVTGKHHGEVDITSGSLVVSEDDQLTGGQFEIDLNTIDVQDIDGEMRDKLMGHLRSEDFFHVENHPTATFEITEVTEGATANDLVVSGNLTIRGTTKNITFDATTSELSAESAVLDANFNIAREDWGVNYQGKADDLISKEINFDVHLVAKK